MNHSPLLTRFLSAGACRPTFRVHGIILASLALLGCATDTIQQFPARYKGTVPGEGIITHTNSNPPVAAKTPGPEIITSLKVRIVTAKAPFSGTKDKVYFDVGPTAWSFSEGFRPGEDRTIDLTPFLPSPALTVDDLIEMRLEKKGLFGFTGAPDTPELDIPGLPELPGLPHIPTLPRLPQKLFGKTKPDEDLAVTLNSASNADDISKEDLIPVISIGKIKIPKPPLPFPIPGSNPLPIPVPIPVPVPRIPVPPPLQKKIDETLEKLKKVPGMDKAIAIPAVQTMVTALGANSPILEEVCKIPGVPQLLEKPGIAGLLTTTQAVVLLKKNVVRDLLNKPNLVKLLPTPEAFNLLNIPGLPETLMRPDLTVEEGIPTLWGIPIIPLPPLPLKFLSDLSSFLPPMLVPDFSRVGWRPEHLELLINGRIYAQSSFNDRLRHDHPSCVTLLRPMSPEEQFVRGLRIHINDESGHKGEVLSGLTTPFKRAGISGWELGPIPYATVVGILRHQPSFGTDDGVSFDLEVESVEANRQTFILDGEHGIAHKRYIRIEYESWRRPIPSIGQHMRAHGRVKWDTDKAGFYEIHPESYADVKVY